MIVAVADISSLDISSRKEENPWVAMVVLAAYFPARAVCLGVLAGPGEWPEV